MALVLRPNASAGCCCPPMPGPVEDCPPPSKKIDDKYFHEVGAEMIGNQLIIRMEKENLKRNKKKDTWEPPCDCDVIEIKRPTGTKGPRIVNGGDNNQILFRIHSKAHLTKKDDPYYKPQAIAYKINRNETQEGDRCKKITVYPQLGGPVTQEVYTDHISECGEDVYLLRVKKKNDAVENGNKRNLEVELRTPKLPPKPPAPCPPKKPFVCKPPEPLEAEKNEVDDEKEAEKNGKKAGKKHGRKDSKGDKGAKDVKGDKGDKGAKGAKGGKGDKNTKSPKKFSCYV